MFLDHIVNFCPIRQKPRPNCTILFMYCKVECVFECPNRRECIQARLQIQSTRHLIGRLPTAITLNNIAAVCPHHIIIPHPTYSILHAPPTTTFNLSVLMFSSMLSGQQQQHRVRIICECASFNIEM